MRILWFAGVVLGLGVMCGCQPDEGTLRLVDRCIKEFQSDLVDHATTRNVCAKKHSTAIPLGTVIYDVASTRRHINLSNPFDNVIITGFSFEQFYYNEKYERNSRRVMFDNVWVAPGERVDLEFPTVVGKGRSELPPCSTVTQIPKHDQKEAKQSDDDSLKQLKLLIAQAEMEKLKNGCLIDPVLISVKGVKIE